MPSTKTYTLIRMVVQVPAISQFYGILIYIYKEESSRHHMPHFHALYSEHEAVYDFEGNLVDGKLPRKQSKLVEAWTL